MAKARIFYGSSTGNTQRIASRIEEELGDLIESVTDIAEASPDDLASAQALILGVSTWEDGQLQEDWEDFFPELDRIDLSGTTVALFGLGDAYGFSGEFVDALGTLYRKVRERGATVVGSWPTDGYDFDESSAVVDGRFVGLVIDEENEADLSDDRVARWADSIRSALAEA
jgi:flavodoxin I